MLDALFIFYLSSPSKNVKFCPYSIISCVSLVITMFKSVVLFISLSSLLSIGWYVFGESLLDSMRPSSLSPIDRHNPIDEIGVGFDLTLSYG